MKLQIYLFLFFLFSTSFLSAQQGVQTGEPYKVIDASDKLYFEDGNNVIAVKLTGDGVVLQRLNTATLKLESSSLYDDFPRGALLEKIVNFDNKLFVFYSLWDKTKRLEQLFYREIDFATGNFGGSSIKLLSVENELSGRFSFKVGLFDKFDFKYSADSTKILITYSLKPEKRNDRINYEKVGFCVIDSFMNILYHEIITMPYTEEIIDNINYVIDSEGTPYILIRKNIKDKNIPDRDYEYNIFKLDRNTGTFAEYTLKAASNNIKHARLYINKENILTCVGFYNTKEKYDTVDGLIIITLDINTFEQKLKIHEIPSELMVQFESKKTKKKAEKKDEADKLELPHLNIKNVLFRSDGSMLLVGEQDYERTVTYTDANGSIHYRTYYHYEDIYLFKLDKDLNLLWQKKIPKQQVGSTPQGSMSYKLIERKNGYVFVIFDNIRNMSLNAETSPYSYSNMKDAYVFYFTVDDNTGTTKRNDGFSTAKVNGLRLYQYSVKRIFSGADNSFLLEAYKKKKEDILVKVKIK